MTREFSHQRTGWPVLALARRGALVQALILLFLSRGPEGVVQAQFTLGLRVAIHEWPQRAVGLVAELGVVVGLFVVREGGLRCVHFSVAVPGAGLAPVLYLVLWPATILRV